MTREYSGPATRGLALSGGLGAGKTTIARRLSRDFGMRLVRTVVTRPIETDEEDELIATRSEEFIQMARRGEIILPLFFGECWYGYLSTDWESIRPTQGAQCVFNVRPYTGLVLGQLLPAVVPVWLEVAESERLRRLTDRKAQRDSSNMSRSDGDITDNRYRVLYPHTVDATNLDSAMTTLLGLLRAGGCTNATDSI